MTTVVVYKWARDVANAQVRSDGTVEWRSQKLTAGEDDPAAVATAMAIATARGEDVVGVTLGDGDVSWALARGAARAVSVADAQVADDDAATAAVLAAAVRTVPGADVVVIGDDEAHPGVAVTVAGHLGWPAVVEAARAEIGADGIEVVRRVDDTQETLAVTPPVVIGVRAEQAETRTPGMKEQLAARKRPVSAVPVRDLDLPSTTSLEGRGTRTPQTQAARVFSGDPTETAAALVSALRAEGVL